jgi:hypothetical protein
LTLHSTTLHRLFSVDSEQLILNVESIDWSTVYTTSSVDEQVTFFNHAILNLFEQSFPLRRGVRRPNVNPWFDMYIAILVARRDPKTSSYKIAWPVLRGNALYCGTAYIALNSLQSHEISKPGEPNCDQLLLAHNTSIKYGCFLPSWKIS